MRRAARLPPALVVAALALASPALAAPKPAGPAPIALTQTSPPASYKPGGKPVAVLGIAPGMPPDAVRAILEKSYGPVLVAQDNLGLADKGVAVATQTFITRMAANKGSDQITVWFATPTTGNGAVEVTRQVSFGSEADAPALDQVRTDLIAQYGKPGFDGAAIGSGEVLLLAWSFKGDKPSPCPQSSCRADLSEGVDVRNMPAYTRAVKTGHDLTVVATLLAGIADPDRAAGVVVTMSDAATKLKTLEAAITQMRADLARRPAKKPTDQ